MKLSQFLVIPRVIWSGARSWFSYLDGSYPEDKKRMIVDNWGWTGEGMAPHWKTYFANPSDNEEIKNLGSEWTRLAPQRGYKVMSMFLVWSIMVWPVAFAAGLALGLVF